MTNEEWERQRIRAIMGAFQTGRPVFADTDGELRYGDGDREKVAADVGVTAQPIPRATALAIRAERASHYAFVTTVIAAIANTISAYWRPWQLAAAVVCVGSAFVFRRLNQHQRSRIHAAEAEERSDG